MNCCLHVKSTIVPDETVCSCLDPGLPRTSLQGGGSDMGPGPPSLEEKSQSEPSRDGRGMTRDKEKCIRDLMQEDQRPTE
jgi:hypothetical protein